MVVSLNWDPNIDPETLYSFVLETAERDPKYRENPHRDSRLICHPRADNDRSLPEGLWVMV